MRTFQVAVRAVNPIDTLYLFCRVTATGLVRHRAIIKRFPNRAKPITVPPRYLGDAS